MLDIDKNNVCEECLICRYYWENQDDEFMNCEGEETPCLEYIEKKEELKMDIMNKKLEDLTSSELDNVLALELLGYDGTVLQCAKLIRKALPKHLLFRIILRIRKHNTLKRSQRCQSTK